MQAETLSVQDALTRYFKRALTPRVMQHSFRIRVERDPNFPSHCLRGEPNADGLLAWSPVLRVPPGNLAAVEAEFGVRLHPAAVQFLGLFWAHSFQLKLEPGLLFAPAFCAGEAEWERLLAGIRSHLSARISDGAPLSIVIGHSGDDRYFTVDNLTGKVLLEDPGAPARALAPSLVHFLSTLPGPEDGLPP